MTMHDTKSDNKLNTSESNLAMLLFGQTHLLVPQRDIRVLDLVSDMDLSDVPEGGIGWTEFRQQRIPVYCLSEQLEWRTELEPDRTICALLEAEREFFGLLCTEVSIIQAAQIDFFDIPAAMRMSNAPYDLLAMSGDTLACVSSASLLCTYLPHFSGKESKHQSEAL